MVFRRLLGLLLNQTELIEKISETKPIRRAAQILVAFYNDLLASGKNANRKIESNIRKSLEDSSGNKGPEGFINSFKNELHKEIKDAKKDGKL